VVNYCDNRNGRRRVWDREKEKSECERKNEKEEKQVSEKK
jgi:hypothetical protein